MCEKHFAPSDFVTKSSYTDVETGRVVEVPLRIVKLKQDAIPSLFPDCPVYLSRTKTSAREAPEEKRKRLEAASLNEALQLSIDEEELQNKKNKVTSFSGFLDALPSLRTSDFWTVCNGNSKVFFLNLTDQDAPAVRSSVTVTSDLCVLVYIGETRVVNLAGVSAAINSASPAKTAHVFMTQSLLSSRKDVVHIMPVAQMDAKTLHDFLRMLVVELESSGFKVIAVISDNNSINRKTMSFFSNPPSLKIVYQHPADPS
ncbi:hypothetical protein HPB47_017710, partial [Ixodes persulcatus]